MKIVSGNSNIPLAQEISNYLKLPLLGLALANFLFISRTGAWRREINNLVKRQGDSFFLASAGFTSLLLWTGVLTCGRMIGYW